MKPWIQNVVTVCKANGGRITSGEVEHQAGLAGHYGLGSNLITQLRASRSVTVEVIAEEKAKHGRRKIYRITKRDS